MCFVQKKFSGSLFIFFLNFGVNYVPITTIYKNIENFRGTKVKILEVKKLIVNLLCNYCTMSIKMTIKRTVLNNYDQYNFI